MGTTVEAQPQGEKSEKSGKSEEEVATKDMEEAPRTVLESESEVFDAVKAATSIGISKLVPVKHSPDSCLARHRFNSICELQLNHMINVVYNMSYTFSGMANYFNKDRVGFRGLTAFFLERSESERENGIKLSDYLLEKGGVVKLREVREPPVDYHSAEKGDALHAMELTVAMEKVEYEKYIALAKCAEDQGDEEMVDYFTDNFLHPQVALLKKHSSYVSQLRRVTKGHGHWHWDKSLAYEYGAESV